MGTMTTWFEQDGYQVRFDWGQDGAARAGARGDVVVVVDTLRFSTTVAAHVAAGAQVIGIGMATPYANRQAGERSSKFPFPILSDIGRDRPAPAHTAWGRFDPDSGTFLTGLFLVDRSGMVEIDSRGYVPASDPAAIVKSLCEGKWPE